jgi:hypothetical protein
MDKRPSRMQGQFYFSKSDGAEREHALHPGSEGRVPKAGPGPTLGKCDLARGMLRCSHI